MDSNHTADLSSSKTFAATSTKATAAGTASLATTERDQDLTSRTTETAPLFGDAGSQTNDHHTGGAATAPSSSVNSPVDDGEDGNGDDVLAISNNNNDRGRKAATMRAAATWMTRTFCREFLREMAIGAWNFIQQCCDEMVMDEGEGDFE